MDNTHLRVKVINKEIEGFNTEIERLHEVYKLGFISYEKYIVELNYLQGRVDSLFFALGVVKS